MKIKIYEIPGKLVSHYFPNENTIIDTWTSLYVSFDEWKRNIYDIGILDISTKNRVDTWITDTSHSEGVFNQEIQSFRKEVSARALSGSGVKLFITVMGDSSLTTLSARSTSRSYGGQDNLDSYAVKTMEDAFKLRKREMGV